MARREGRDGGHGHEAQEVGPRLVVDGDVSCNAAIQAQGEGFEVYVVTDASGGVSREAHDMAVRRMVQAGIVPITWMALLGEWQRDGAREKTLPDLVDLLLEHGGSTGVAYAWELQLLAENKQPGF